MASYDYATFIEELRERDAEVPELMAKHALHKDMDFQRWKHAVIDAIQRIEAQNYVIHCDVVHRRFSLLISFGQSTPREQRQYFQNDLGQTQIELRQLIDNFEKYGDPRAQAKEPEDAVEFGAKPATLVLPPQITIQWVMEHVPVSWWCTAGGIVFASFMGGVSIGHSKFYADLINNVAEPAVASQHSRSAATQGAIPPSQPKAASTAR